MLSILLGHKVIKVAHFSLKGKKIALFKCGQINFDSDLFEADRVQEAADKLKGFLVANRIKPQKTVFCLSHHDIVSRELVLPLLPRHEAEAIIVNEIEKAPRFASNPYVYTYQLQVYPFDHNTKVIYYVFQKSLLQTAESILRRSGCQPVAFDVAPLSILNAFRSSKLEQVVVYVDDKLSHLMACRGQECRASYLFNTGAEDLSSGSGIGKEGALRNFSRDIASLLKKFYDSENTHQLPVVFAGEYPLGDDFFKQMTTLTSHQCSSFSFDEKLLVLPKDITALDVTRRYAPVVGAMFRLQGKGHYFNIFNIWDFRTTQDFLKGFWFKIGIFACFCVFVGAMFFLPGLKKMNTLEAKLKTISSKTKELESITSDLKNKQELVESLRNELFNQAEIVSQVHSKSWRDLFQSFNDNLPDDLWLESISHDQRARIVLKGVALNLDSIALMIQRFKDDSRFLNVKLASTNERKIQKDTLYQFIMEFTFSQKPVTKE